MSSALLCADLALDNPFVFVPQAKPDLLRKRLPNLSKLAGVTLGSRLEIRGAPDRDLRSGFFGSHQRAAGSNRSGYAASGNLCIGGHQRCF